MTIEKYLKLGACITLFALACTGSYGQDYRWQQRAAYEMDIKMDVANHQFVGKQKITYTNNSPDTLGRVFYHLYFNAFQPGSMMDTRSLTIEDPDSRVGDRISKLKPNEIGYQHVKSLSQDGKPLKFATEGTILEVALAKPLYPGKKTVFEMAFEGQVPLQVRRSGRDSKEGISYSMAQWYPKLCEYDFQGWHANPYIGREFHGVWGDFDVKITLDSRYIVAGSGLLQNPEKIGYGYEKPGTNVKRPKSGTLTWHFVAENVHDFVWAADPDYTHTIAQVPDGPTVHFFYQKNSKTEESWSNLPDLVVRAFQYINKNFGRYPYPTYSIIQGGDGGMEYPMATLVTGERSTNSLLGVSVHEMLHSWYQGVLATNESLYPWMDEGFTSYATAATVQHLLRRRADPYALTYARYAQMAQSPKNEPLTTHADHYKTNGAYRTNAYGKGAIVLHQLGYVISQETMMRGMRRYFNTWKFRHPTPNDFMRVMEKTSGLELDWYFEHFVGTTNIIDYGLKSLVVNGGKAFCTIAREGQMMMPLDVHVAYQDGSEEIHYIPLRMMRGEKAPENDTKRVVAPDWPWTNLSYTLGIALNGKQIKRVTIDPSGRMADINPDNDVIEVGQLAAYQDTTK